MFVFAVESVSVRCAGYPQRIHKGYAYDAHDPIVLANPSMFQPTPVLVARSDGFTPEVEQATAAPGERRSAKRG